MPRQAQSWARLSVERLHVRGPVNDDDEQARLLVYGSVVLRFVGTEVAVGTRSGHLAVRLKSARALADPAPPPAAVAAATCWHHPSPERERISCAAPSPRQPRTGRSAARAPAIRSPRPCRPVSARVAQRLAALQVMAGRWALEAQAPAASSRASASRFCRVRRNMDSHSTTPRIASASKVVWSASAAHSAIAVNEGRRPAPRMPPGPGS